ncbi:chemokine-like factor [Sphaerodactylus townsendi]|uniref:chemokine-like factor n=1 Tax=Sphaerodactylus townsendi TaxID=933632 RepID=UPI002026B950|nr:chemokine-like factor [Sphaerodactylus townsendi]
MQLALRELLDCSVLLNKPGGFPFCNRTAQVRSVRVKGSSEKVTEWITLQQPGGSQRLSSCGGWDPRGSPNQASSCALRAQRRAPSGHRSRGTKRDPCGQLRAPTGTLSGAAHSASFPAGAHHGEDGGGRQVRELRPGRPQDRPHGFSPPWPFIHFAWLCSRIEEGHEAFVTLVIMEFVITGLFFCLYLLGLQKKLQFFFWPLADAFNSLVAALFFIIVGLCATVIKTNTGTLVGGVFCLLLFVLSIADAIVLLKMITFNKDARRNPTRT